MAINFIGPLITKGDNMTKYHDPKTGKTVEATNRKSARKLMNPAPRKPLITKKKPAPKDDKWRIEVIKELRQEHIQYDS